MLKEKKTNVLVNIVLLTKIFITFPKTNEVFMPKHTVKVYGDTFKKKRKKKGKQRKRTSHSMT